MLLISAGAIIITPDTPLLFFWSVALYALVRIFCGGGAGWWWVVGIAMGLALQSKYTTFLLGPGLPAQWSPFPDCSTGGGARCHTLRVSCRWRFSHLSFFETISTDGHRLPFSSDAPTSMV